MIRSSTALVRQLRAFMETSGLPWNDIRFVAPYDEEGKPYLEEDRIEISFRQKEKDVGVVIWAPSDTPCAGLKGKLIPCGWLVGRCEGEVASGQIDQTTWDAIVKIIRNEEGLCPNLKTACLMPSVITSNLGET